MQCMSVTTAIMFTTCEYHFGNVRSITFTFRLFIWVCLLSDAKPRIQLFDTQCIKKCLWIVVRRSLWWNTISMVSTVTGCAKHAFYDFIVCNAVVDINGLTWTNHMGSVVQDLNVSPAIFIRLGKCPPPPGPVSLTIFFPAIQIRWKLRLAVIPLLAIRSKQIFAHARTAQLSCHIQNFAASTALETGKSETKLPSNLNCDGKPVSETGPSSYLCIIHGVVYILITRGTVGSGLKTFVSLK